MAQRKHAVQKHEHQQIAVQTKCADCGQELGHKVFNRADVEAQRLTQLPNREAMSLANINVALPINLAAALNILSDGSIAAAIAEQTTPIEQAT